MHRVLVDKFGDQKRLNTNQDAVRSNHVRDEFVDQKGLDRHTPGIILRDENLIAIENLDLRISSKGQEKRYHDRPHVNAINLVSFWRFGSKRSLS